MADNQDTPMDIGEDKSSPSSDQLLLDLMTALATGARAVQGLPSGDEFEYRSSLPEFRHLVEDSQESLLESLLMVLEDAAVVMPSFHGGNNQTDAGSMFHFESLDDPLLWETCMDLCDALLEQAEHSGNEKIAKDLVAARGYAQSSFGRLLNGIVEMEKPQQVFQFGAWNNPEMNDRTQIFVPPFLEKKYFAKQELDVEALKQPGHGMDTKFGETKSSMRVLPSNVIAPSHHILHAYLPELEVLEYPDWELEAPAEKVKIAKEDNLIDSAVWIDTPVALNDLKTKLEHPSVQEVAIDLEAHSYRSFAGMICLIQITCVDSETGKLQDYLLDPFPLWNLIHKALAPTLANPHVVKIFHGADSDMAWLQRDFGLFVVNLFDTGRAAMALKLPSYGFAHVLERYVKGAKADKTHQLSDWRQRPLPEAMKEYAIIDTHYLLDIYSAMKYDIAKSKTTSIKVVLEESRKVCTIRYTPELFRPDGYRNLADCHGQKIELNHIQEEVLKELWDWRDQTARQSDESHAYVCTNTHLMRLAMACPTNLSAFQGLMQPMPPMLIRNSKEILTSIQNCILKHQRSKKVRGSHLSSAFFKPAVSTRSEDMEDAGGNRPSPRTLMSPVLGTEALYRQAGWVTPAHPPKSDSEVEDILTTSATEDDADDEKDEEDSCRSGSQPSKTGKDKKSSRKNRRSSLAVNDVNRNFQADRLSSHSMQMGNCQSTDEEGNIIDGFGPVRVSHRLQEELDEATGSAKSNAAQIRTTQECRGIIGLISSSELGGDELEDEDEEGDTQEEEKQQEDFVIPRSMREIYRISNRNRRNKKSSSPGPPEPNKEELEELAKAEKVLKARSSEGKNYVDVIPVVTGSPKRQRTKSVGGASISSSDEAGGTGHDSFNKSREDDIALMQEVGWIVSKEELDSMITQGHQSDKDDDDSIDGGRRGRETPKTFDYSNVGPIGAFAPAPSSNPFFAGAALQGGHLNQQFGKFDRKKSTGTSQGGSKPSRHQIERPEKRNERAQAFKKK